MTNVSFGVVAIAAKTCKCGQPPRAVVAWNTREDGAGVQWLCREHGDALAAAGVPVQSLTRTCGAEAAHGAAPCGATATHIAILGVPGRQGVHALSVCSEHLSGGGEVPRVRKKEEAPQIDDGRREQIAALDRTVVTLTRLVGLLGDAMTRQHARLLALQHVLIEKGLVTDAATTAKMQEFELGADAALALAPEYGFFRKIRDKVRREMRQVPEVVTAILNESDAVCGGCGADPRAKDRFDPAGWYFDLVQTPDGPRAEVRCPQCW